MSDAPARQPAADPGNVAALQALRFSYPWRKYQQMVLDLVERQAADANGNCRYHIVAPPGSGKTVVGWELIRRFGCPAVVFAPTTTIQQQWIEKLALFTDDQDWPAEHASNDPRRLADVSVLTYQSLSTPGENLAFVEEAALGMWVDDLLQSGREGDEAAARARIDALRQANPSAYRAEVGKRYRRHKRELLRAGAIAGRQLLHENARALIDGLVAQGVGTVVLDECHHLLDYWAYILRELIGSLPTTGGPVRVVGLTATLPTPEDEAEYENYAALLGDVDFEVPTPAVVKEGNLAPYRDLAYFCEPSKRERDYLNRIQGHFEAAVSHVTGSEAFRDWVLLQFGWETGDDATAGGSAEALADFLDREPALCIAGVRYLRAQGMLPADAPTTEEMEGEPSLDDWLVLLEGYALGILTLSQNDEEHELLRELRQALLPFGVTISERGIRHGRSPGDLVLALSEAKDAAAVEILRAEAAAMDESLRALVITDFERLSATGRRLNEALDADAGSAVRAFRRLLADAETRALVPMLVTGQTVLAAREHVQGELGRACLQPGVLDGGDGWACKWQPTADPDVLQLVGSGAGWSTRVYVSAITGLFDRGVVRCLVGTRGIFGEGWDSLRLNTVIDLTSVTTSTGVQQIRGRAIRLDPEWPRKVAHNWDVICVARRFDKGDADLRRLAARHEHTWGIVVPARTADLRDAVGAVAAGGEPSLPMAGRVVRGLAHVDLRLTRELAWHSFKRVDFAAYSRRALAATRERERVYDLWQVGEPYSNFSFSATEVRKEDVKFRTVYTVAESLRTMLWRLGTSLVGTFAAVWLNVVLYGRGMYGLPGVMVPLITAIAVIAAAAVNARATVRAFRRTFVDLPADAVLLDMGRALLAALRDAGAVSARLADDYVRVVETEDGGYEVFVDYASPADADAYATAYRQMMGPIGDARYLIERDASSLRNLIYRPLWAGVRRLVGLSEDLRAYHRVPDVLAGRKERAETFARHWRRYVGGGRLVYTRNTEGRRLLLQARAKQRRRVRQLAFETWR